jgi:hypothetical protein
VRRAIKASQRQSDVEGRKGNPGDRRAGRPDVDTQKAAIRAQPRTDILLKRDWAVTTQPGEPLGFHCLRENRRTEAKNRVNRRDLGGIRVHRHDRNRLRSKQRDDAGAIGALESPAAGKSARLCRKMSRDSRLSMARLCANHGYRRGGNVSPAILISSGCT